MTGIMDFSIRGQDKQGNLTHEPLKIAKGIEIILAVEHHTKAKSIDQSAAFVLALIKVRRLLGRYDLLVCVSCNCTPNSWFAV